MIQLNLCLEPLTLSNHHIYYPEYTKILTPAYEKDEARDLGPPYTHILPTKYPPNTDQLHTKNTHQKYPPEIPLGTHSAPTWHPLSTHLAHTWYALGTHLEPTWYPPVTHSVPTFPLVPTPCTSLVPTFQLLGQLFSSDTTAGGQTLLWRRSTRVGQSLNIRMMAVQRSNILVTYIFH